MSHGRQAGVGAGIVFVGADGIAVGTGGFRRLAKRVPNAGDQHGRVGVDRLPGPGLLSESQRIINLAQAKLQLPGGDHRLRESQPVAKQVLYGLQRGLAAPDISLGSGELLNTERLRVAQRSRAEVLCGRRAVLLAYLHHAAGDEGQIAPVVYALRTVGGLQRGIKLALLYVGLGQVEIGGCLLTNGVCALKSLRCPIQPVDSRVGGAERAVIESGAGGVVGSSGVLIGHLCFGVAAREAQGIAQPLPGVGVPGDKVNHPLLGLLHLCVVAVQAIGVAQVQPALWILRVGPGGGLESEDGCLQPPGRLLGQAFAEQGREAHLRVLTGQRPVGNDGFVPAALAPQGVGGHQRVVPGPRRGLPAVLDRRLRQDVGAACGQYTINEVAIAGNLLLEELRQVVELGDNRLILAQHDKAHIPAGQDVHKALVHYQSHVEGAHIVETPVPFGDAAGREAVDGGGQPVLHRVSVGGAGGNAQVQIHGREHHTPIPDQFGQTAQQPGLQGAAAHHQRVLANLG